ncbi:ferredoxin [Nocardia sputorum]|uniref:ferredoxin n=1 Tax=Nocardia sputorum TaxID=2984338 RepID=UPI00249099F7|nr:ferredoxin [Nocardia sputorum]BDT95090.1 ferredoxin [Nocardia sputorum]
MELRVDRERCVGAGMCVLTAPGVFDQDTEDGRVVPLDPAPAPEREPAVRAAAEVCPSGAITIVEQSPREENR